MTTVTSLFFSFTIWVYRGNVNNVRRLNKGLLPIYVFASLDLISKHSSRMRTTHFGGRHYMSVPGALCPGGLCPGGFLSMGSLCPGEVSVRK